MAVRPNVALVAGVGDGLGGAVARRFARAGHPTVLVARTSDRLARIAHHLLERVDVWKTSPFVVTTLARFERNFAHRQHVQIVTRSAFRAPINAHQPR